MKSHSFDILCFGSITLDTFLKPSESIKISNEENFHFPVGDKIQVESIFKSCGGSAANTSIGFSKMGFQSAAFGFIGDDEVGNYILNVLETNNVRRDFLTIRKNSPSSFSMVLTTPEGRRTIFHYKNPKEDFEPHHLLKAPITKAVYVGHVSEKSEDMICSIPKWKKQGGCFFAWNPGETQIQKGFKAFAEILPHTDLLIMNKEEAAKFSGESFVLRERSKFTEKELGKHVIIENEFQPRRLFDVRNIAQKLLKTGIKTLVITDAKRGAQLFDQKGNHFYVAAPDVDIQSTLGAGDAFSVGFISAVLKDQSIENQLRWGTLNAGSVIQKFGAQKGQLTLSVLKKLL